MIFKIVEDTGFPLQRVLYWALSAKFRYATAMVTHPIN